MRADVGIDVLTDMLIDMFVVVIAGIGVGVLIDVAIAVLTSEVIALESVVPLPDVEAVIDVDGSLDRRVGKLIGTLARV